MVTTNSLETAGQLANVTLANQLSQWPDLYKRGTFWELRVNYLMRNQNEGDARKSLPTNNVIKCVYRQINCPLHHKTFILGSFVESV